MALVFAVMHLCNVIYFVCQLKNNCKRNLLSGINKLEWSTIPACPSLMCSFIRDNIEGTNSSKIFV